MLHSVGRPALGELQLPVIDATVGDMWLEIWFAATVMGLP
jgi:hypothetical protein